MLGLCFFNVLLFPGLFPGFDFTTPQRYHPGRTSINSYHERLGQCLSRPVLARFAPFVEICVLFLPGVDIKSWGHWGQLWITNLSYCPHYGILPPKFWGQIVFNWGHWGQIIPLAFDSVRAL